MADPFASLVSIKSGASGASEPQDPRSAPAPSHLFGGDEDPVLASPMDPGSSSRAQHSEAPAFPQSNSVNRSLSGAHKPPKGDAQPKPGSLEAMLGQLTSVLGQKLDEVNRCTLFCCVQPSPAQRSPSLPAVQQQQAQPQRRAQASQGRCAAQARESGSDAWPAHQRARPEAGRGRQVQPSLSCAHSHALEQSQLTSVLGQKKLDEVNRCSLAKPLCTKA